MKSWLKYICLFACCMPMLSSCVLDEEVLDVAESCQATVELTLSYSDDSPMSRDVSPDDEDGSIPGLDNTTPEQKYLSINDIFVLAFEQEVDQTWTLLDYVKDLQLVVGNDNIYTIKGNMPQQSASKTIRFVVLTNLVQNGIVVGENALTSKESVENYLKGMLGETDSAIYDDLIYNYDVANDGTWIIADRRIPMWGVSAGTTLNRSKIDISEISLYRAVAKVQIWVNGKKGFKGPDNVDFTINRIDIKNANKQGYCVSREVPDESINVQYQNASVPVNATSRQDISFDDLEVKQYFSDQIYLPEHKYQVGDVVTLTIHYTYNGQDKQVTATFNEDIIRNHSYIFNINKVNEVTEEIYYVVDEWDEETINIPSFN